MSICVILLKYPRLAWALEMIIMLGYEIPLFLFHQLQAGDPTLLVKTGNVVTMVIAPFGEAGSIRFIKNGLSVQLGMSRKVLQAPHDPVELEITYEDPSKGPVVSIPLGLMSIPTYVEIMSHYEALWVGCKDYPGR